MRSLGPMRCVVFGAGGFIGTNLCRKLAGRVSHVRGFGRPPRFPAALAGIDWAQGDFSDVRSVQAAVEGCDTVFHLISTTTPASANADMPLDLQQNVLSTLHLLEACRAAGVRRIVFVSSGGTVYGIPKQIPTPEDAPTWPISAYGVSKLAIERYLHLHEFLYGLEFRILRLSNPFGPFQIASKNQGVIAAFLQRALSGQPLEVWGDGTATRDYVYIDDVVDALERAALDDGEARVFNIGAGVPRSIAQLIEAVADVVGHKLRVERRDARQVDVPASVLDISRSREVLGWTPQTGFREGLTRTAEWMRSIL